MNTLDMALALVRDGTLSIDGEGRIWRHRIVNHGETKAITPRRAENVGGKGYLRLTLQTPAGKTSSVMAHRVVWAWFKGPIPEGQQINHKDLDKQNNRLSNLELTTDSGNIQHSYANGRTTPWSQVDRQGLWRNKPLLTHAQVAEAQTMRDRGALLKDVAKHFGISVSHAHRLTARAGGGNDA